MLSCSVTVKMGASYFLPSSRHRHDRIEIFDYTSLLVDGRLLKPVQAPACLDELIDWTISANLMMRDMPDMIQVEFRPYIKTLNSCDEPEHALSSVSQFNSEVLQCNELVISFGFCINVMGLDVMVSLLLHLCNSLGK